MTLTQSVILGITQGITEFLPISSSGHLILVPAMFGWELQDLSFDVALHLGTAIAVLLYFWRDWFDMLISLKLDVIDLVSGKLHGMHTLRHPAILLFTLIVVSIPVGLIGFLLESTVEETFRSPIFVSFMLVIISFFMFFADKYSDVREKKEKLNFIDYLIISLSQIVALFPGSSRSGMSISTGLFRGLDREKAAKFSFLLATPIILGASIVKLPDLFSSPSDQIQIMLIGLATSFITGMISIKWLMFFLKTKSLKVFVVYRILLGAVILIHYFSYAI
ncbi:UDP-diphosphatase [candidate division WWE3 bacterium CG_4_9_14_0_2_um_filter_35_11]|uniref:Undecaprenyl-diphosphatase n=1 Tax=candidate division WWE3 bacterium CG_4_9_14_0_2_um_filter_35_11 TaxID=1975077 RepID=A0A2M8ELP4_UNCKA|nr:MAG: UDP-diphosphatase [candidate division WWE3 bacterium CG10_big_fil_rev_8_21_14_0_10_35_32]PJC23651.1 MAG: UDP-diphosphatase [candidate division WWE3 bacterium CG_4_9_14_0_2_um_filter_35_11]